jgi:hypothetical protein
MWHDIRRYYHYFFFISISFISIFLQYEAGNFKPIIFHDSPYPVDPSILIGKFSTVWRDIANFGFFDPSGTFLSLWYIFLSPVYILTNNLVISQFAFLFAICNITLFSSYHFARYVGVNKYFSIIASVLYLANPYSIFYIWRILNANIILYAVFPLILLGVIGTFKNKNQNSKKYILILFISELVSLSGFANLAYYASFIFVTLLFSICYSILTRSTTQATVKEIFVKNTIIAFLLILPISTYFVSIIEVQPRELSTVRDTRIQSAEIFYNNNTKHTTLPSLFSLTALPPLYEKLIWFSYESIYLPNISIAIGFVVASVILFTIGAKITVKNGLNKDITPFVITFIILCILLLRETGYAIFNNFPLLRLAFRDPYHKFETEFTLILVILFCYCGQQLFEAKIVGRYKLLKITLFVILLVPIIYWTAPFFSGNFVPTNIGKADSGLHTTSAFTNIPYEYMPAINYLKHDKDIMSNKVRVLVYPLANILWCDGNGSYWGNDILRFSGISTISTIFHVNFNKESRFISNLSDTAFLKDTNYLNTISKLGVKYLLVRKQACDVNQMSASIIDLRNNSKEIEEQVKKLPIKLLLDNKYYSLFQIANKDPISIIIAPSYQFKNITKFNFLNYTTSYDNSSLQQLIEPQYHKISSTEYMINVRNINKPFYIILAESYDDGWKAIINGKDRIIDKYHFITSGFANAWYIDKAGNFNMKLYFQPQQYYEISLTIYIVISCVCIFYLGYDKMRTMGSFMKRFLCK